MLLQCRGCGARNPSGWESCVRCRRSLRGSPLAPPRERDPSWGLDVIEKARGRAEAMARCQSCGVDNPVRFVCCQVCRGPTREVELPTDLKCRSCEQWNRVLSKFCAYCGDPIATTGDPATWRPDGCPGCWGDVVAQPGLSYCGTCGFHLPATLLERRDLLRSVAARRSDGRGYRGHEEPPEVHPARCELLLTGEESLVWLALDDSARGVIDLDIAAEPLEVGDDAPRAPTGSLLRLARWIRRRLNPEVAGAEDRLTATVEAACSQDERVVDAERIGTSLLVRIECGTPPSVKRIGEWLEHAAAWSIVATD